MDTTTLLLILGLVIIVVALLMRNRSAPPGSYDDPNYRSSGSIGGALLSVYAHFLRNDENNQKSRLAPFICVSYLSLYNGNTPMTERLILLSRKEVVTI